MFDTSNRHPAMLRSSLSRVVTISFAALGIVFSWLTANSASAACVEPVRPPQLFNRLNWSDLENLSVTAGINSRIDIVQSITGYGQGDLNIDQYSITIDKNGQSPVDLLQELRNSLSDLAFTGDIFYGGFKPLDDQNGAQWQNANFVGAVMVFTLAAIPGLMDLETGAVVVSCQSQSDFIFSTVKVGSGNTYSDPGWHPVSGNRAFGVRDNGDDSMTIFVKAADRIVNQGIFSTIAVNNEFIYSRGNRVWVRMLDNLTEKYAGRNPRNRETFSERVAY